MNPAGSASAFADPASDPKLDVGPSVANMPSHPEAGGSFSAVAPGVDGCDGDFEVVGELLG